jgi:hypothetical protein
MQMPNMGCDLGDAVATSGNIRPHPISALSLKSTGLVTVTDRPVRSLKAERKVESKRGAGDATRTEQTQEGI